MKLLMLNLFQINKIIVIATMFIIFCMPVVVSADTTEPTTTQTEPTTELQTEPIITVDSNADSNNELFPVLLFGIGTVSGCLLGQGLSFWKW